MKQLMMFLLLASCLPALADAVDRQAQVITVALAQEPPNLNGMLTTDAVSNFIIGHTMEGLVRYGRRGEPIPGVAESWELGETLMRFRLREDARWSDGSPVVAADFVFAWRWVNDPANAAPFAAIMHPIRNAAAIQRGELPAEQLGVRAVSERELVVELERPCGYCLSLMAHTTFFPVKGSFYQDRNSRYGSEPEDLLFNGPFMLTEWVHNSRMKLVRHPGYWGRDAVKLKGINIDYITEDNRTRLNLFRDGRIAYVRLGTDTVQDAVNQGLRMRTFPTGGVAFLWFNHRDGRATGDLELRRAIQDVFDSELYVNKVVAIPGYQSTGTFFPGWLRGVSGRFVTEYPPPAPVAPAGAVTVTEPLTLLTVASPTGQRVAEYLQGLLKRELGLDVKLDQQSFKQYLEKSRGGDFDLALSSWYPDFNDIVTYADMLVSWNPNNRGGYRNPAYDEQFRVLQAAIDPGVRMAAAAELQRLLIEDAALLPMAETGSAYIQHPQLKGVIRRVIGQDPDYTHAEVR